MSLANLGAAIRMVLDTLTRARALRTSGATAAADARNQLAALANGTGNPTLAHAAASLTAGVGALDQGEVLIASAMTDIVAYTRTLGFPVALPAPPHPSTPAPEPEINGTPERASPGHPMPPEITRAAGGSGLDTVLNTAGQITSWIRDAGTELPQRPGGKGPTHGSLHGPDGRRLGGAPLTQTSGLLRSGGEPSARDGLKPDWYPISQVIREHVEAHAAAYLRRPDTPRDAVLVINKTTCVSRGQYVGCDELLPGMLPEGKRLAVYVSDGKNTRLLKVYKGTGEGIAP